MPRPTVQIKLNAAALPVMCYRNDGIRRYRLQRRPYNGLPGLAFGQRQRPIQWIHENSVDASRKKCYCVYGMAGKTISACSAYVDCVV